MTATRQVVPSRSEFRGAIPSSGRRDDALGRALGVALRSFGLLAFGLVSLSHSDDRVIAALALSVPGEELNQLALDSGPG